MQINDRELVAFDTECHTMRRGFVVPPLVCLSLYAEGDGLELILEHLEELDTDHWLAEDGDDDDAGSGMWFLLDAIGGSEVWPTILLDDRIHLAAHSVVFDLQVLLRACDDPDMLDATFARLRDGTVSDTMIRERMLAIADGTIAYDPVLKTKDPRHNLAQTVTRRIGVDIGGEKIRPPKNHKDDPWPWVCEKQKCPGCDDPPWMGIGHPNDHGRTCEHCDGFGLHGPWRLRYAQLSGVPLDRWPERPKQYAASDARWVYLCLQAQAEVPPPQDTGEPLVEPGGMLVHEANETRSWWALSLMATWGMRTDPKRVRSTVGYWEKEAAKSVKIGQDAGFVRANGSENRAVLIPLIEAAYTKAGKPIPKTAKGNVQYGKDKLAESGNPLLVEYSKGATYRRYMSNNAKVLQMGTEIALTSSPNPIVATDRTGWSNPPLQQPPKEGGYRECHVARDGYVYGSADYETIEICSLAQQHIDWGIGTTLRDKLAAGLDLHVDLASDVYAIPYDELLARVAAGDPEAEKMRFTCKAGNFGFMGGMGAKVCVATYGIETFDPAGNEEAAINEAARVRDVWHAKTPEMREYFAIISSALDGTGTATAIGPTGMQRLCDRFTSMANHYFQHRTALGAKRGIWDLALRAYTDLEGRSPVYGVRPWLMLHDEVFAEIPTPIVQEAAPEMARILQEAMQGITPDIPIGIEPNLMRRWYKRAKPVKINGLLVPWEPWTKLRDADGAGPAMWRWVSGDVNAVAREDGSWRAFNVKEEIANGTALLADAEPLINDPGFVFKLAKHRAECAALGEDPWV